MRTTTGFGFPPLPPLEGGGALPRVQGAEAVADALRQILRTEPGERLGRPTYGVGLRRYLFAPDTLSTRVQIRDAVASAIRRDEPRAELDEVRVEAGAAPGWLRLEILYRVVGDPTPRAVTHDLQNRS